MRRVPRVYVNAALQTGEQIELTDSAHNHLSRVLRLKANSSLRLFNGDGFEYSGDIKVVSRHCTTVTVTGSHPTPESRLPITLALGCSKPKYFDLALQKSTEMGVQCIVPLRCARSPGTDADSAVRRAAHWQGVIISACEQCGRTRLPVISDIQNVDQWITLQSDDQCARLLLDPNGTPLQNRADPPTGVTVAVGPEGGFNDVENSALKNSGFASVSLGPRILRTETAPVAMLALVQYLWGDLA